jgi:aminomethyltransferase
LKPYTFTTGSVAGQKDVIISATGYTGEPGFELYIDTRTADPVVIWDALLAAGATPAGLGARDTLRLEMGYALYGQDINADTTPLEGRLGWLTKLDGQDFIGKDAIVAQKQGGIPRRLCGFIIRDSRQLPRHGYAVESVDGTPIGTVTSGGQSITLEKGIGMALLDAAWAKEGTDIRIVIREQRVPAAVTTPPFIGRG